MVGLEKLRGINLYDLTKDRKRHTLGVVNSVIDHYLFQTLSDTSKKEVVLSALYHDVGYSKDLEVKYNTYDDHPLVGFRYLKSLGVSSTISKLVLHHTYSELMTKMKKGDLTPYLENKVTSRERKLLFILNSSDIITSSTGQTVTVAERYDDILRRYEADHIVIRHFQQVMKLHSSDTKHFMYHRSYGTKYIEKEKAYWKNFVMGVIETADVLGQSLQTT